MPGDYTGFPERTHYLMMVEFWSVASREDSVVHAGSADYKSDAIDRGNPKK